MVKKVLFSLALFLSVSGAFAQISEGGVPPSLSLSGSLKSAQVIPAVELQSISRAALLREDKSNGTPFRYGVAQDVSVDIKSGVETVVGTGTIWRYEITSDSALSLKLMFSQFVVPEGAELFVYNSGYAVVYGAFTAANVSSDSTFAIADFPGNSLIIEYYEPSGADFEGVVHINLVSMAYKDLSEVMSTDDSSDYIDVNCGEGINWQLDKHSVCRFTFTESRSSYLCSGALINNVNNNGTPYFLTANHCVSSSTVATTVVAYFNYETEGCGLDDKATQTLSGTTLLTTGSKSDYTLLKFSTTPPSSYQPYYAGWDLTDSASSTVGIHHPEGLRKKISIDNDAPVTYASSISWSDDSGSTVSTTPANTHWEVGFDKGITAGGSSGSPLFNESHRIIGQLHGGDDNGLDNYYGKLNYSWDHPSSSSSSGSLSSHTSTYSNLSVYLAGDSSVTYIDGYTPSDNYPEAIFSADYEYVCVGSGISFTDYSLFGVTKWTWTFTPSTVTYLNNTTKNSQNPVVSFDVAGTYDVKLVVQNSVGKDSVTYTSDIVAGSTIAVSYESNVESGSCLGDLDSLVISASGANSYQWVLSDGSPYFTLGNQSGTQATISQNTSYTPDSTVTIAGSIIGTQGTCADTSAFSFSFLLPYNDNIANAKLISTGTNGPFSNECATVETSEPVPPVKSCTTQTDWCDEYGTGEDIVENSVWFCFYGPSSGAVSIEANDMDGQIALYEANSYLDILNGNYTLLAANDDISSTNSNSKIKKTTVTSGKMYWIQFDGSGGGTEGDFYIVLNEESSNSVSTLSTNSQIIFYPQPASDYLVVSSSEFAEGDDVMVKIYNQMGSLVYSNSLTARQNSLTVGLESSWPGGVYIVSVTGNGFVSSGKFTKATY